MPLPSDRPLRRLIAELATLRSDDVEAIIERMDSGRRQDLRDRLRRYVDELNGPSDAGAKGFEAPPGLSTWLAIRLGAIVEEARRPFGDFIFEADSPAPVLASRFRMTPAAVAALRSAVETCAAAHKPIGGGSSDVSAPSLFQRFRSAFRAVRVR
jgi:hypothetical protein